jgi:hypothetical protein
MVTRSSQLVKAFGVTAREWASSSSPHFVRTNTGTDPSRCGEVSREIAVNDRRVRRLDRRR